MHRMPTPSRLRGFTLIEACVTLAILVILAAVGLPSFAQLAERQRTQTALHLLSSHFAAARMAAITYGIPTGVCPGDDHGRCRIDSDWSGGWLIYQSPGSARQPTSPDDVLRVEQAAVHPSLRFVSSAGRQQIRFLPDGRSAGSNLTITLCRDSRALGQVVVNNAGRTRTALSGNSRYCAISGRAG